MHAPATDDTMTIHAPDSVQVPDVIPIFPLPKVVMLPGEVLPLHIFEPRYKRMKKISINIK